MNKHQNRAFYRWLKNGPKEKENQARSALDKFLPTLESSGFIWVEKDFDGGKPQVNSVSFERDRKSEVDFICFLFDKYRSGRFKIMSGTKRKQPPHKWVIAGDLVRYQSESDKAKWWGPSWWSLNRKTVFKQSVEKISSLLPELIEFLNDGKPNLNIYQWSIK